ncbi:MAG TPA: HPF/RaiA family ribosome-associated protein [Clostridia bacterium]|nr:HPF/RaiA family ribosome-associated protein [Clostridia bacterium]
MRPHNQLRQKLQQKIRKLEIHLEHFPSDAVFLQVSLERHPRKPLFVAGLTLFVPSNILRAEKTGPDPIPAFDQAIKTLLREVALLKSSLRRESEWKREARWELLAEAVLPRRAEIVARAGV